MCSLMLGIKGVDGITFMNGVVVCFCMCWVMRGDLYTMINDSLIIA